MPLAPSHGLLANLPQLAIRTISQTGLGADFDYYRDQGYSESEIAGMAQRAILCQRVAAAEAAVASAAPETPKTSVAYHGSTVSISAIPSRAQPTAYLLLNGDALNREHYGKMRKWDYSVSCRPTSFSQMGYNSHGKSCCLAGPGVLDSSHSMKYFRDLSKESMSLLSRERCHSLSIRKNRIIIFS